MQPPAPAPQIPPHARPLRVTLSFAAIAALVLLASEALLTLLPAPETARGTVEVLRDWVVVAISAGLVYLFTRRSTRAVARLLQRLHASERRFRDFTSTASDWIWESDADGRFTFLSNRFFELTGVPPDRIIGRTRWELATEQDEAMARHRAALERRERFRDFIYCPTAVDRSGSTHYFKVSGRPVYDSEGRFIGYRGIGSDVTAQRLTELALRESAARLRAVLDTVDEGIITLTPDGRIRSANRAAETIFGLPAAQLEGSNTADLIDTPLERLLDGPAHGARPVGTGIEVEGLRQDGSRFPLELSIGEIRLQRERLLVGVIHDISERRDAQERLRRSEEALRLTLQHAPIGICTTSPEGRLLSVNPTYCQIFGYEADELIGMSIHDLTHPDDRALTRQRYSALRAGEIDSYMVEKRYCRRDGEVMHAIARAALVHGRDGTPLLIVGEVEDITERKQQEREMVRIRAYLKDIIDAMPSLLVGVDTAARVTEWNRRAAEATGITAATALGEPFAEVLPAYAELVPAIEQAMHSGEPVKSPRLTRSEGHEVHHADVVVYPLTGAEGAVVRIDDVTARVRMEEMMVQTEKMLSVGGLAAGMAHEINNPLGVIMQGSQNLSRRLSAGLPRNREVAAGLGLDLDSVETYLQQREVPDLLEDIQAAGTRAAKIVSDMLTFARRSDASFSPHAPQVLLDFALRLATSDYDLRQCLELERVDIVREHDPELAEVWCDGTEIEQVLLNLLKNAVQAMATIDDPDYHPRLTLRSFPDGAWACIEIADNGPGMDEQVSKRVFEPFFTTKPVGRGTGLGLSVSYFIVTELHRGQLSVDTSPGAGTRFSLRLPLRPASGGTP